MYTKPGIPLRASLSITLAKISQNKYYKDFSSSFPTKKFAEFSRYGPGSFGIMVICHNIFSSTTVIFWKKGYNSSYEKKTLYQTTVMPNNYYGNWWNAK